MTNDQRMRQLLGRWATKGRHDFGVARIVRSYNRLQGTIAEKADPTVRADEIRIFNEQARTRHQNSLADRAKRKANGDRHWWK